MSYQFTYFAETKYLFDPHSINQQNITQNEKRYPVSFFNRIHFYGSSSNY